jgi:polar amino acid transport system substrate-binding protein
MAVWTKIVAALVALTFGACMARAEDFDTILAAGKVRAGVCLTSGPAGSRDSNGNVRGFDVDVATLLAQQLGVALQIVATTPESRTDKLLSGQFDVIICTMTATPERGRQVDFSLPYLGTGIKLLVPKGSPIQGLGDIGANTRLLVERSTTSETMAKDRVPKAQLLYAENAGDVLLQMRQGHADAALDDGLLTDWAANTYPGELVSLPQTYSRDSLAIATRKNNPELLRWLDLFASRFVSSGQYAVEYRKWFGADPPPITAIW